MSEETIRKILIQVLSIGKLAVKLMPWNLNGGTGGQISHFVYELRGTTLRK
jgi:hypothetical protein